MSPHVEDVLLHAIAQRGDRYIFGAEAKASDPNPTAFDCSELVEWACARAGVDPRMPDGAYNQWRHCTANGKRISVADAIKTRGALLFVGDGTGSGRNAITHVAWSLGDGTTIEARGSKWGVGTWPSTSRFDFGGLMPGVDYSPGHGRLEDNEMDPRFSDEDVKMIKAASGRFNHLFAEKGEPDDVGAAMDLLFAINHNAAVAATRQLVTLELDENVVVGKLVELISGLPDATAAKVANELQKRLGN